MSVDAASMRRRRLIAGALAASGTLAGGTGNAALALPGREGTLAQALRQRRSVRRFGAQAIDLDALARLLWAAQGVTTPDGRRSAPSAGALYPLELHVVAARVAGLAAGVHRYVPATHTLEPGIGTLPAAELARAAGGQDALASAAAVVVIAAVEARTARKYGARAARYVAIEAGAAAQNLALQAVAERLGTVVIGAFDDAAVARLLALSRGEQALVLMPVGHPA